MKYLSLKQIADRFNVHRATVHYWRLTSKLTMFKIGNQWVASLADVEKLERERQEKPNSQR